MESAYEINKTGGLLPNKSNKVYVSTTLMTASEAFEILFLSQKTYKNWGQAVVIIKLHNYQEAALDIGRNNGSGDIYEMFHWGSLKPQKIIYAGPNPFGGKR